MKTIDIDTGFTFVCVHDNGDYSIQYSKEESLDDIMVEVKEFLLACGFSKTTIEEYIDLE